jgi:hypothetical protein
MAVDPQRTRKIEAVERSYRKVNWSRFAYTRKGRMSWADWFPLPKPKGRKAYD